MRFARVESEVTDLGARGNEEAQPAAYRTTPPPIPRTVGELGRLLGGLTIACSFLHGNWVSLPAARCPLIPRSVLHPISVPRAWVGVPGYEFGRRSDFPFLLDGYPVVPASRGDSSSPPPFQRPPLSQKDAMPQGACTDRCIFRPSSELFFQRNLLISWP